MREWDFLWGLDGQELEDAMSSGGTQEDWDFIEEQLNLVLLKEMFTQRWMIY